MTDTDYYIKLKEFPDDIELPLVLFIDGCDRIGKTSMINKMPKMIQELSKGKIDIKDIEVFHSSKSDICIKSEFPKLITENKLLNYHPTSVDELFALSMQIGMVFCQSLSIALETQYESLKDKKIIIVDRGPISNAVYGLASALTNTIQQTKFQVNTHHLLKQLYDYFIAFNLNSRLFLTNKFDYFNITVIPNKRSSLININNFEKKIKKENATTNIWEDDINVQLLIYDLFTQIQSSIGSNEVYTMTINVPYRKFEDKPIDYMTKYAYALSREVIK